MRKTYCCGQGSLLNKQDELLVDTVAGNLQLIWKGDKTMSRLINKVYAYLELSLAYVEGRTIARSCSFKNSDHRSVGLLPLGFNFSLINKVVNRNSIDDFLAI